MSWTCPSPSEVFLYVLILYS